MAKAKIKKVIKGLQKASKTHAKQAKTLQSIKMKKKFMFLYQYQKVCVVRTRVFNIFYKYVLSKANFRIDNFILVFFQFST